MAFILRSFIQTLVENDQHGSFTTRRFFLFHGSRSPHHRLKISKMKKGKSRFTSKDLDKLNLTEVAPGLFRVPSKDAPILQRALSRAETPSAGTLFPQAGKDIEKPLEAIKSHENQRIKNATKVEVDGIRFDSRLEAFLYGLLKQHGIRFDMQVNYTLQEKFRFGTELIRPILIRVDFVLLDHNMIVDSKGFQLADNKLKYKMLKRFLHDSGSAMTIEMPKNQKECRELVNRIAT